MGSTLPRPCGGLWVESEGRREVPVGVDLRLQIGNHLRRGGHGIGAGDETARRRLLARNDDERSRELGRVAGLLAILAFPELDSRRDLIAGRFDAGMHLGEFLQKDMVAVKVTAEQRAAIVAAPSYFDSHPKPKTPRDLTAHRCIRYRMGTGGLVYRWEFEKRGKPVTVSVSGPLIVNDVDLTLRAALDGVGLAFALEEHVAERIARGELVRVLEDWCPPFEGFFLYYPSRRQQPAALRALVDALRV